MTYFQSVKSLEDLKAQYRKLALENHPDCGGNVENMKAINNEYDQLFPIWKNRSNDKTTDTADSTRSEFYTQNGWKGENYQCGRTTKEIAQIIRTYCKEVYSDCKFSVTYDSYSMGSSISVSLMEAPFEALTTGKNHEQLNQYSIERDERLTEKARTVFLDLVRVINSYRMDDSDSMIDYFCTNFHYSLNIGKWDKPFKVVAREPKKPDLRQYETVVVKEIKTRKGIQANPIDKPNEIAEGQYFRLKGNFTGGACAGNIYKIADLNWLGGAYIDAYKMDRKLKKVCTGDTRGNRFFVSREKFLKWVEQGVIEFVNLNEVEVSYEVEKKVKRLIKPDKKIESNKPNTNNSAPKNTEKHQHNYKPSEKPITDDPANLNYAISQITDSNGLRIWIVQFCEIDQETFKIVAKKVSSLGAYYSKLKKGFIFRKGDPTKSLEKLFGSACEKENSEAEENNATEIVERIESISTDIILDLRLRPGEYAFNSEYRKRLNTYLQTIKNDLTETVIEKIPYKDLKEIVISFLQQNHEAA